MTASIATLTIEGVSPYSQSRQHDEPKKEGESHEDYDRRTWPSKAHVIEYKGKKHILIPAHGIQQTFTAAAKYSKRQIVGQGKATWTAKFSSGIMLLEDPILEGPDPDNMKCVVISANADGIRGSGKRVTRRFPTFFPWRTTMEVHILDPIITEPVFRDMAEMAGTFIGLGRFRPEKGGTNGRFNVVSLAWEDNRRLAA